jgi:uncharacterized membrane protein YfcA
MNVLAFSLIVCAASVLAGFLGALTGLGGGVVIVPVLCLIFKVDLHYAIGASLISVIATSSGAAAAYVREGFSNIRIGMFLEVATTELSGFRWRKMYAAVNAIILAILLASLFTGR